MAISRSENMRRIRGKNTEPELIVQSILRFKQTNFGKLSLPEKNAPPILKKKTAIDRHGGFRHRAFEILSYRKSADLGW